MTKIERKELLNLLWSIECKLSIKRKPVFKKARNLVKEARLLLDKEGGTK